MLNKIIAFSIKNKLIIGLFILALIGYGSYQLTKLPIDAVPDITDNQVQVITVVPSLGAPDIERLITFPIEQANSNIPGLKQIRSFSRFGLSLITIVFDDNVDIYWARQQVTERLKLAEQQIPKGIGLPELAPVTTGLGEIYQYILKPKPGYEAKYDATELRTIQDWIVRRQLISVKGVADVSSFGGRVKQYEIAIDVNKLKSYNITINDVFTALEKNNENTGGAYIEKQSTVLYIRTEGLIGNRDDIKNIVVKNTANGTPLLINDIAQVQIGSATRYGAITYNDEEEVAGAVVMMLKGGNSSRVIEDVKEKITQIRKTLPEGVELEAFLDRTKMVKSAIGTVSKNLMEGALIVIFVLVLFLGNFRAGILVASVIPLAMLFAVILMNIFGVSGNLMSLGALDFGLIVDGAVIIVEAVMHSLVHNKRFAGITKKEMDIEVNQSASRMMNSAVFGQIIILIVYLPIFALEGIEGKMFKPMAQTVAFALLGAFILSLTYIPMMSALFLNKNISDKKNISDRMMDFLVGIHQKYLAKVLHFPKAVIALSLSLLLIALVIFSQMGGEFIPALPEGDFAVETRVLPGSSIATSSEAIMKSAHILKSKFPEIEKIVGKTGSGEIPTDPMPMEASDMMIILKDKSEWTSAKTWDELSEKMSEALKDIPGVTFSFQFPVAMRFNELMTGAKQDVVCKIFGENLDTLSKYSKLLGDVATTIKGAKNIYIEPVDGLPQVIITYKRNAIAQYGLNIQDINKVVNTAFAGQSTGLIYEDEKRFDIVVRLAGEQRKNLEDVQNLLIPTFIGTQIPLYQVADVSIKESVSQIQRENAKRRIIVGFNINERDVQSTVKDLQLQVEKKLKLPTGYYITYGGAFENLIAAKKRLSLAVPLSLLLIFLLLYFAFNSVKQGLLIYSAIPLSAIGGIFFLALRGMPFSISAGVGFIALFGVAVLNGIVLIAEFNRLRESAISNKQKEAAEKGLPIANSQLSINDLEQITLQGTKIRLRPVLMTAFVASMGFLPMALSNGAGAEVQRPLATVVIGGLLLATFLTLFVLPILYVLFERGLTKKHINPVNAIAIAVVTLSMLTTKSYAQQPIALKAALDSAYTNNLYLKSDKLNVAAYSKLKQTAWDIPQTSITGEYGQFNSAFMDTKFGVAQSFKFPTVYLKQKTILSNEWKNAELTLEIRKAELKKEVSIIYFSLVYTDQLKSVLFGMDSIYSIFLKNASLKFEKGDSNILEKNTAESQRGQIQLQLQQVQQEYESFLLEFNLLVNTKMSSSPIFSQLKMNSPLIVDNTIVKQHPFLQQLEKQQQLSNSKLQLEKSILLPDLIAGYSNSSITGMGPDNIYYNRSRRFQSFHAGIGIPLFFGSQKAKISTLKINQQIADNNLYAGTALFQLKYQRAMQEYEVSLNALDYYESKALKNADEIINASFIQYQSGNINYLEWVMLTNQAVSIKIDYLNAMRKLNTCIIELNYLTNK